MERLTDVANTFDSGSVRGLLRTAPDLTSTLEHIRSMYTVEVGGELYAMTYANPPEKTIDILPTSGADEDCDEADAKVAEIDQRLDEILSDAKAQLKAKDITYWHSAQGNKEIYQFNISSDVKVPSNWIKVAGTKVRIPQLYN